MYKEKDLIRTVDENGYAAYGVPNHSPMLNWNDFTIVPNEEIEFANGWSCPDLKNGEVIKIHGMVIGNSNRLAGMFEHSTEEEILGELDDYPDYTEGLVTDPLEDWLS